MKRRLQRQFERLKTGDNHWLRKCTGVLLTLGGLLGFLPVLGYWMLPLGLTLLAVDWAWARRASRRLRVWSGRQQQRYTPRLAPLRARLARGRRR
jgi:hypothetical protein